MRLHVKIFSWLYQVGVSRRCPRVPCFQLRAVFSRILHCRGRAHQGGARACVSVYVCVCDRTAGASVTPTPASCRRSRAVESHPDGCESPHAGRELSDAGAASTGTPLLRPCAPSQTVPPQQLVCVRLDGAAPRDIATTM